jgi:hypothetical protein
MLDGESALAVFYLNELVLRLAPRSDAATGRALLS